MKAKYSVKHIEAVARRLTQYEKLFAKGKSLGDCGICGTEKDDQCDNCLINHCMFGHVSSGARMDGMCGNATPAVRKWYRIIKSRANRNLRKAKSPWVIE